MVSTRPDVPPVIKIRKLTFRSGQYRATRTLNVLNVLSDPASTFFFMPYSLELLNKLYGQLFLSKIATRLHDDGYAVPVCCNSIQKKVINLLSKNLPKWP